MTTSTTTNDQLRGIAIPIKIDKNSGIPIYRQIYDAYRTKIVDMNLRGGQLIPSTRALARELRISRIPVLNAYDQLLAEGYFETRIGAGTFISSSLPTRVSSSTGLPADAKAGPRLVAARATAFSQYQTPSGVDRRWPFYVGQPALDAFPFEIWSKLVARYSRDMRFSGFHYGSPMGLQELRETIAVYLRTSRAVRCEPQQIMIVSGSQQALDISTRVLLNSGALVWVEDPGYWLVHQILKGAGCKVVPVPVDTEGLDVAAGIKLCRKARAAFVTPSHQYPLGVTMSATRRLQLLEWAHTAGSWIIEDDYDSEYRYESMPISSLQGLDHHSRVIYIGTFSKVLFPSLRVGYIVIPHDLLDHFTAIRHAMDLCPPHLNQAVLAQFIREGHFARHLRKMRLLYQERRNVLAQEIRREFGSSWRILGDEAGMHLAVLIGDGLQDREISVQAAQKELWLSPLSAAYIGKVPRQGFILGFGNNSVKEILGAVSRLKKIIGRM